MARKVAATPTLDGEDAKRFLEQLEKPSTPEEIKALKLYPVGLSHGTYIIAENEEGMYLIDQHAAYERINYERYMKRLREKDVSKVTMLLPITVELSASDYITLMTKKDFLASLNIDI